MPFALFAEESGQLSGVSGQVFLQLYESFSFDGGDPPNDDPQEGLADSDGDGVANFLESDNDDDGLDDETELAQGSDLNLVTPDITGFAPPETDPFANSIVQVQGTSFEAGLTVDFGSATPTPTSLTPTSFDVDTGIQPEGDVNVTVTLPNGQLDTVPYSFVYLVPTIASFDPTYLEPGESGTVSVTGTNFTSGMTVQLGGQTPTPTSITPTSFDVFVAGIEPLGPVSVTVTLPNGKQATNATGFKISGPRVIFVTSTTQDGDVGGLAGADAICNGLASGAGLSGTFQAWLSDGVDSPATRDLKGGVPYLRPDGAQIASDWADLTDGTLDVAIEIGEDEALYQGAVWTNVNANGSTFTSSPSLHCTGWTSTSGQGLRGTAGALTQNWTITGTTLDCNTSQRLYCIEQ